MQNPAHTLCFVILASVFQRAKGLLGSQRNAGPVALVPCASVHTFGMRYDLDIAFVTKDGVVMRSERSVPSGKVLVAFGAVLSCEAADVASLKSVQGFDSGESRDAFELFAFFDDAVVVDAEHDDGSGVEAARFPSAGYFSFSPELDELIGELSHLQEAENALQEKCNTDSDDQC